MRLIVTSATDIAGTNVYHTLAEEFGFQEDGKFEGMPVYKKGDVWLINMMKNQTRAEHLDDHFDADYYVFASRHRSESGERTLTVHVTGNLTEQARVGGNPRQLAYSEPHAMKVALKELKRTRDKGDLDYRVSMEATHHGPTSLERPVLFVEVGSTEKEWQEPEAVRAVAGAALAAAENHEEFDTTVGLGGNHYAPIHTKVMLETDTAVGHIVPSYAIMDLDTAVLKQAVEKTSAAFGVLDWKGMDRHQRKRVKELAGELGLELKRTKDLREDEADGEEYKVNKGILEWAVKGDQKGLEAKAAEGGMTIIKDSKGRPVGRVASENEDAPEEFTRLCLDIITDNYEVALEDADLVITEARFDPGKARQLGIKPGPLYGKLSAGMEIVVDSRTVTPGMVTERVRTVIPFKDEALREVIYLYMKGKTLRKEDE